MRYLVKFTSVVLVLWLLAAPGLSQTMRYQQPHNAQRRTPKDAALSRRLNHLDQLLGAGDTQRALDELVVLIEAYPSNPSVLYKSYEINLTLGKLSSAEQDLKQSITLTNDADIRAERQEALDKLLAKEAAEAQQKKAAAEKVARERAEAEDKATRLNFIQNRVADGNSDVAITELRKLLGTYTTDADLYYKAFEYALRLEQFDAAGEWLNRSIELTSDATAKVQRKAQLLELDYKRTQALALHRRQELAVQFKKLILLAGDAKAAEVTPVLDQILKTYPDDAEVHFMSHEVFVALGDFVAAEYHLKKSIELTKDSRAQNDRQVQFIELNYKREKAVTNLVAKVDGLINDMNYPDAAKAISGLDNIVLYNQPGYLLRAGLLGLYRQYEEAAKTYKRLLEDSTLSPATRAEVTELRDYCVHKISADNTIHAGFKRCHFCHAEIPMKAAYCSQCLSFQHPISLVRWKNTRVNFVWEDNHIREVNYRYENQHKGSNAMSVFGGMLGAAAVGAGASPSGPVGMSIREAELSTRDFIFKYEQSEPQGVKFSSSANGGELTTMVLQGATTNDPTWQINETGGGKAAFKLEDLLVYPNHPKLDPIFAQKAFKQNITRGFSANWNFDPSMWSEPHVFVFYYDNDARVSQAVECYTYSDESNAAGHRVATGRKPFAGANRQDPLNDPNIRKISYNEEGLVSAIVATDKNKEYYRREMIYGPQGIVAERELRDGKVIARWKYEWKNGQLVDCLIDNKAWQDQMIIFQVPSTTQPAAGTSARGRG